MYFKKLKTTLYSVEGKVNELYFIYYRKYRKSKLQHANSRIFCYKKNSAVIFLLVVKGEEAFSVVVSLKKKYDRLKRSLYYFSTIVVL
ncbi:TPA: hypothetical protein QCU10_001730 [Bacillus anthracis]|nr:hypothetical protein BACI_c33410 [Bacillus cereus biovar anthracis str. CI]